MEENNIIDYGSISVPESWEDITLKQYQQIEEYYNDKEKKFNIIDVLDIFIDKDKDYIMSLPSEFLEMILEKMSFIQELPKVDEPSNKIEINGETYQINFQNKLKTGEYIAVDTAIKADRHNYASILAILCRKEGEIYDSKFENEILEDRIKLFEKQPIIKILNLLAFFLNLWMLSEIPTRLSSVIREEINHTAKVIETLRKSGDLSILATKRLIRELKKLEKSIKSI